MRRWIHEGRVKWKDTIIEAIKSVAKAL